MEPQHLKQTFVPEIEKDLVLYGLKHTYFYRFVLIFGMTTLMVLLSAFTLGGMAIAGMVMGGHLTAMYALYRLFRKKTVKDKSGGKRDGQCVLVKNDRLMELYVVRR